MDSMTLRAEAVMTVCFLAQTRITEAPDPVASASILIICSFSKVNIITSALTRGYNINSNSLACTLNSNDKQTLCGYYIWQSMAKRMKLETQTVFVFVS